MKSIALHGETGKAQIRVEDILINDQESSTITARIAPFNGCPAFLPEFFRAGLMSTGGVIVCGWMKTLSKDYRAVPWDLYILSNGGFYMAPQYPGKMKIEASGHFYDYEGEVSADAAGIIATLLALESLEDIFPHESLTDFHQWLIEYVRCHPESSDIYRAIFRA